MKIKAREKNVFFFRFFHENSENVGKVPFLSQGYESWTYF